MNTGDFDYCLGIPCEIDLRINCTEQPTTLQGKILSPGFPLKITDENKFGIVFCFKYSRLNTCVLIFNIMCITVYSLHKSRLSVYHRFGPQ